MLEKERGAGKIKEYCKRKGYWERSGDAGKISRALREGRDGKRSRDNIKGQHQGTTSRDAGMNGKDQRRLEEGDGRE